MENDNPRESGRPRCIARSKQTGMRCRNSPKPGWKVCRFHGAGGGRPPTAGGRYSGASKRFEAALRAATDADDLLDLRPVLGLLDVRMAELLDRLDPTYADTPAWRLKVLELIRAVKEARTDDDRAEAIEAMRVHVDAGAEYDAAWAELLRLAERRQRRTEAAIATRLRGEQAINARDLVLILGRVLDVLHQEISDEESLGRVIQRLDREVMGGAERLDKKANKPWLN